MTGTDAPDMKAAALELHDAGWWPIPNHWITSEGKCFCLTLDTQKKECDSPGKHPLIRWEEAQKRQLTRDEIEIYWDTWPLANIGVITGPESGIVCLDVDVKDGVDGNQTIRDHADAGRILPETFTDARGDGKHSFFWYPKNAPAELRNIQDGKLGPGLDLRAAGGQVIIAPSMHYSGERRRIVDPRPPVELPQWVIDLALSTQKPEKTHGNAPAPLKQVNEKGSGLPLDDRKRLISAYVKKHFPDKVVSGNRHHALMQIGGLMRSAGSDAEEIFDYLTEFNLNRCDPPKPDAASEIREIAGYMAGKPITMSPPCKRRIRLTHRPLPDLSRDGIDAIQDANEPPRLFIRGGEMVFPDRDEKRIPFIRSLTEHGLKGELARAAEWYHLTKDKEAGYKEVTANPTLEIARDILCRPTQEWGLYPLASITQTPIIDLESGKFRDTEGYDLRTCTYYLPSPGFTIPEIPENPTNEDISRGKDTIEDIFCNFPFVDDRAKHNAYAGLITAILRPVIPGPVPLFLVDKPQAGCGASLMQKCIYSLATGEEPEEGGAPEKEEEWGKSILSILAKGRQIYTFDNIDKKVSSEALSRLLTSINFSGRLLGTSRDVTYPNRVFWMANGNNVEIGGDIARRVWVSKIDPQMALPWQRTNFKHPDILSYCKDHRGEIVGSVFTLVRGWILNGSPLPSKIPILGGYEGWHTVVGGIMECAGYTEFLQNVNEIAIEGDIELKQDEEFLSALFDAFGSDPWQVKDIETTMGREKDKKEARKVLLSDCLPDRLADAWKDSSQDFKKRCGRYLRTKKGKRYPCGLMVTRRSQDLHDKVQRWCVVMWDETPQTPQTEQGALITSGVSGVCGVSSSQCMMRKKENNDHVRAHVIGCGNSPHTPHTPQTVNTILIRILQHVGTITGSDGREYELQAGDTVTLPEDNARALIDKHAAVEVARTWEKPIHIRDPDMEEIG